MLFENDWIPINKREDATYHIDWTPNQGGWVRVRWLDDDVYAFKPCSDIRYSLALGERMLDELEGG